MVTFKVFRNYYIRHMMDKHPNNKYWETATQVIENLGGMDQIEMVYSLWCEASPATQERICGMNASDIEYREHALSVELSRRID